MNTIPLVVLLAVSWMGCGPDCDRRACQASARHATTDVEQGIAGAVAYESDIYVDGCGGECRFDDDTLFVWQTQDRVMDEPSAQAIVESPPDRVIQAQHTYQERLEAGTYLLCASPKRNWPCVTFGVVATQVTTINVVSNVSGVYLRVFAPDDPGAWYSYWELSPFSVGWL